MARTAEHVIRAERDNVRAEDTQLVSEEVGTGVEQWSVSRDPEGRFCSGVNPQLPHGLLISITSCWDGDETEDDDPGGTVDGAEGDEPADREHVAQALDPGSGEQVWERTWTRSEDDRSHISSGGPTGAGADPVLLVRFEGRTEEGLVLDPETGDDVFTLPEELRADGTWFLGADSESAAYRVDCRGRDAVFEHGVPQGNVLETIENVPCGATGDSTAVLDEMLLYIARSEGHPTASTREFGQQTEYRTRERIRLDEQEGDASWRALVPVPGAVVAVAPLYSLLRAGPRTVAQSDRVRVDELLRPVLSVGALSAAQAHQRLPGRWMRKKYKRLRTFKKAHAAWQRTTGQYPRFFAHWRWVPEF